MSAQTGSAIDGTWHLKQSIRDILTTPIGSRVMRRDYGSRLPDLIDAPTNRRILAAIYSATASALRRWEPRFKLQRVSVDSVAAGSLAMTITGTYLFGSQASDMTMTVEVTR